MNERGNVSPLLFPSVLSVLSFSFHRFWLLFSFLHFRYPHGHSLFYSIPFKISSFIAPSLNKISLSLYHVFLIRSILLFLLFICLVLLHYFYSFIFALFSFIHLNFCSVVTSFFPICTSTYSAFSLFSSCYFNDANANANIHTYTIRI